MIYFFAGFAAALIVVAAAIAFVYQHLRKKNSQVEQVRGYLDLIPDLSDAQRQQVQRIRETFLPRVAGIRQNLCDRRAELAVLLFADPVDRERIAEISQDIITHQARLEDEVIRHILEEKEFLTPSQNQRFYEIIIDQFSTGGLGVHDIKGRK